MNCSRVSCDSLHQRLVKIVFYSIIIFMVMQQIIYAESILFIQGRPCADMPNKKPYSTIIYQYNENNREFVQVWALEENVKAQDIDIYYSSGYVLISEGKWTAEKLYVLPIDNINNSEVISLLNYGPFPKYRYFQVPGSMGQIQIRYLNNAGNGSESVFNYRHIQIDSKREIVNIDTSNREGELRLSGPPTAYGGGESDVIGFKGNPNGGSIEPSIDLDDSPIPDGLIKSDSSRGWVLIANETSFRVFQSIAYNHGLTKREILIYNREEDKWHSIIIDGSETSLILINNWLAGVVADVDPETDFKTLKGFPPILREEVVLVNPLENHQFSVHLGKQSEVLWIEEDTVYYRVGQELYKARIENDDFVDRTLLISDPVVKHIHWAFRGSSGE